MRKCGGARATNYTVPSISTSPTTPMSDTGTATASTQPGRAKRLMDYAACAG